MERHLRSWGYEPEQLAEIENWHGGDSMVAKINAASFVAMGLDMRRNLGTRLFHALSSAYDLKKIIREHKEQCPEPSSFSLVD